MMNDGTSKIKRLPSANDVNDKIVDLSRFETPITSGRHNKNRRDW